MNDALLTVRNLHVKAEDGPNILKGLNLTVERGKVHVILGPNGAGKSTLANIVMGHPRYVVTEGEVWFDGENITDAKTDERARKGIFMSFQAPEEVAGVTVENFLRTAKSAVTGETIKAYAFHKQLLGTMKELDMDPAYASRYLNVGFSGGEKKKNEILQMMALDPKLAILDETDSGLDVDAVNDVAKGINQFRTPEKGILIITHNTRLLDQVKPDRVHVLVDGRIAEEGDASLVSTISEKGFGQLKQ